MERRGAGENRWFSLEERATVISGLKSVLERREVRTWFGRAVRTKQWAISLGFCVWKILGRILLSPLFPCDSSLRK